MKKTLLFIILMLFTLNLISQVVTVDLNHIIIREHERVYNEETEEFEYKFPDWPEPTEIVSLLIYDLSKSTFLIDNERKSKLQIYEVAETNEGIDDDGDDYVHTIFLCTDEVGVKCIVSLIVYDKINIVQLTISYSNLQVYYHGYIRKKPINQEPISIQPHHIKT